MNRVNDIYFLNQVMEICKDNSLDVYIFGGWAEELWGISTPRLHNDIDLLFRGENLNPIEKAIYKEKQWKEIIPKRFPHKRAITIDDIMVEFFLVNEGPRGLYTDFFSIYIIEWPVDTFSHTINLNGEKVNIASKTSLRLYRKNHHYKKEAYKNYIIEQKVLQERAGKFSAHL